jgi:hypothetical protein
MVESDHIAFGCRWIYKLLMWEVEKWNCACKNGDLCRCILPLGLMMRTKTRLTSHPSTWAKWYPFFKERFAFVKFACNFWPLVMAIIIEFVELDMDWMGGVVGREVGECVCKAFNKRICMCWLDRAHAFWMGIRAWK